MYVDPVITGDLELDNVLGHLSFTMKLSLFWQDFRLVIRFLIIRQELFKHSYFRPDLNRTDWFHVSYRAR